MDKTKNCREYCRFSRYCYQKGEPGLDPDDCPTAWKIEDVINEPNETEGNTDESAL